VRCFKLIVGAGALFRHAWTSEGLYTYSKYEKVTKDLYASKSIALTVVSVYLGGVRLASLKVEKYQKKIIIRKSNFARPDVKCFCCNYNRPSCSAHLHIVSLSFALLYIFSV